MRGSKPTRNRLCAAVTADGIIPGPPTREARQVASSPRCCTVGLHGPRPCLSRASRWREARRQAGASGPEFTSRAHVAGRPAKAAPCHPPRPPHAAHMASSGCAAAGLLAQAPPGLGLRIGARAESGWHHPDCCSAAWRGRPPAGLRVCLTRSQAVVGSLAVHGLADGEGDLGHLAIRVHDV